MTDYSPTPPSLPMTIASPAGLRMHLNANGSIERIAYGDILINLFLGTEMEGGTANLYLRRHGETVEAVPLLGPRSPAGFYTDGKRLGATGSWGNIRFRLALTLATEAAAWFWHVELENIGNATERLDLIYVQDLALASYAQVRINEYYVGHYLDHCQLSHPERGCVVASRQNLLMDGGNPWTVLGSLGRGISYATDARQIYGLAGRTGQEPPILLHGLPGARLQHEHAMVAVQDAPTRLEPGDKVSLGFFGRFVPHHPTATSAADLALVDQTMALPEARPCWTEPAGMLSRPAATLFSTAPVLPTMQLQESERAALFGAMIEEERQPDGELLSFFTGDHRHVVMQAKELQVLRPHVHILRTGDRLVPEENALTSTAWMGGVFHSMVTQGHVSINRLFSSVHSYLGLLRSNGQRLFVEMDGEWFLLAVPTAYEMALQSCRWIYKHRAGMIEVRAGAPVGRHELILTVTVLSGPPARFLLSNHVAINGDDGSPAVPVRYKEEEAGVFIYPVPESEVGRRFPTGGFRIAALSPAVLERVGGDELLFADGRSRSQPFLCLVTVPTAQADFRLTGHLLPESDTPSAGVPDAPFWAGLTASFRLRAPAGSPLSPAAARFDAILPWFVHNCLIHYLAPRGIEQYTGGGWGSRDICQGPLEFLLAFGHFAPARDLLVMVFKAQNPDGDWPQWFMFFDRERHIRAHDSHGDIVFWPLLALARYLAATEDDGLLAEEVPFFHPDGEHQAEKATLWHHVERALAVIGARVISGTSLAAYGNGDWNDSLQPAQPAMREHLCSTWTVTLHYQTCTALAGALRLLGRNEPAARLEGLAGQVRADFRRMLLVDGVLTGFAYFLAEDRIEYLLHPRDRDTGLSYSLLPMIHAIISDLLTPEQADAHLRLIKKHLLGPDGARLFDRPMRYHGGPQQLFQRVESAAFFGREIGLMYTHAHLRYAEALAHYGDAEGFFLALGQANPIGIRTVVASATMRQVNCYYSSSDAAFVDRYQASAEYGRVGKGDIPLDGGWRIYSSGPGIWTRLLLQCFLGLRQQKSVLIIDPVIAPALDGLQVELQLEGTGLAVVYHVGGRGYGPARVSLNGLDLPMVRQANPYRTGGVAIPQPAVRERLNSGLNRMEVWLG